MDSYRISWLGVFGLAAVTTMGCKFGCLLWDKIVMPRVEKKVK